MFDINEYLWKKVRAQASAYVREKYYRWSEEDVERETDEKMKDLLNSLVRSTFVTSKEAKD